LHDILPQQVKGYLDKDIAQIVKFENHPVGDIQQELF